MISQMDQVYSNASLTIIGASGVDAQSGLPGVSNFGRRLQRTVNVGNTALLEMPCGEYELNSSKWATRGWTYQEGYLSTRRLIFTPSQVFFLCNSTYNSESIYRLLQRDRPGGLTITPKLKHLIPGFGTVDEMCIKPHLLSQLQEYSKRELTYQSDSLNAFLGVLNSHTPMPSRPKSPFLHIIWGLTIRIEYHNDPFQVYLNWYHEAPAARIPELPSWTWAGWGGPLVMPKEVEGISLPKRGGYSLPLPHNDWEISCRPEGQKPAEIRDFVKVLSNAVYTDEVQRHQQPTYLKQLQITCLVVPIRFQENPLKEAQKFHGIEMYDGSKFSCLKVERLDLATENVAVVQFCNGTYIAAAPFLDEDLDKQDDLIGLVFTRKDTADFMTVGCLLARPLDDGLYERVGAIPVMMVYPQYGHYYLYDLVARFIFMDESGSVLNEVTISERQKELPFEHVGERKTVVLV